MNLSFLSTHASAYFSQSDLRNPGSKRCRKKNSLFCTRRLYYGRAHYRSQAARVEEGDATRRRVASNLETACVERVCASALRDLRKRLDRGSIRRAWKRWKQAARRDLAPARTYTHTYRLRRIYMCVCTRASSTRAGARTAYSRVALGDFSHRERERETARCGFPARCTRDRYERGRDFPRQRIFFFFLIPDYTLQMTFYTSFSFHDITRDNDYIMHIIIL